MSDLSTVDELAKHFNVNGKTIYWGLWAKRIQPSKWVDPGESRKRIYFG